MIKKLNMKFMIISCVILLMTSVFGVPSIDDISGIHTQGENIIITGNDFGVKPQATPWRTSYLNPNYNMNFQETGNFDEDSWDQSGTLMINLQDDFQRISSRDYVRLEYSARGNSIEGYSAGVQADFPQTRDSYIGWWDYFEEDFNFSPMYTGGNNIKYFYLGVGTQPHSASQISGDGSSFFSSSRELVSGDWPDCQENLDLPFGGGFYARCMSWISNYNIPRGEWFFVEFSTHMNSAPGVLDAWREMKINNQRIYFVNNTGFYEDGVVNNDYYTVMRWGGNYGYDDSGTTQYRYYGDMYLDGSFSRVLVGDSQNYSDCTHLELQVPTTWSNNEISINFNQGTFYNDETVYLYIFDENDNVNIQGYPITIQGGAFVCINDSTQSCNSGLQGICSSGSQTCVNNEWDTCTQSIFATTEICSNGIDENCDGSDLVCDNIPIAISQAIYDLNDDAEEEISTGIVDTTSSDLEFNEDFGASQIVGLRFQNMDLPKDATILDTYIQFTVGAASTEVTDVVIYGEDVDNSNAFTETNYNISLRIKTSSFVNWSIASWSTVSASGVDQRTPDLKDIVQEIIDRDDWVQNNAITFVVKGSGHREAESLEGGLSRAPALYVEYMIDLVDEEFVADKNSNNLIDINELIDVIQAYRDGELSIIEAFDYLNKWMRHEEII